MGGGTPPRRPNPTIGIRDGIWSVHEPLADLATIFGNMACGFQLPAFDRPDTHLTLGRASVVRFPKTLTSLKSAPQSHFHQR
jgi:hypothetical protein